MSWCTIESDPGVFTELVHNLGCTDVQLEEIWGMDQLTDPGFSGGARVHGVIFLFQWKAELYAADPRPTLPYCTTDVFFAKQNVNNACATQAIISTLLNADGIALGDTLSNFKEFAGFVDYSMRGDLIGQQDQIRVQHNRFARPEPFMSEQKKEASDDDEAFHFVAYVEKGGAVYELDGLRAGPIRVGAVAAGQSWLGDVVQPEIQRRCAELGSSAIKFSLMAVVGNKAKAATARKAAAEASGDAAAVSECDAILQSEAEKFARYKVENTRRRHNYVPLAIGLLKAMAAQRRLMPAHERALGKAQARREERLKKRAEEAQASSSAGGN